MNNNKNLGGFGNNNHNNNHSNNHSNKHNSNHSSIPPPPSSSSSFFSSNHHRQYNNNPQHRNPSSFSSNNNWMSLWNNNNNNNTNHTSSGYNNNNNNCNGGGRNLQQQQQMTSFTHTLIAPQQYSSSSSDLHFPAFLDPLDEKLKDPEYRFRVLRNYTETLEEQSDRHRHYMKELQTKYDKEKRARETAEAMLVDAQDRIGELELPTEHLRSRISHLQRDLQVANDKVTQLEEELAQTKTSIAQQHCGLLHNNQDFSSKFKALEKSFQQQLQAKENELQHATRLLAQTRLEQEGNSMLPDMFAILEKLLEEKFSTVQNGFLGMLDDVIKKKNDNDEHQGTNYSNNTNHDSGCRLDSDGDRTRKSSSNNNRQGFSNSNKDHNNSNSQVKQDAQQMLMDIMMNGNGDNNNSRSGVVELAALHQHIRSETRQEVVNLLQEIINQLRQEQPVSTDAA